MSRLIQSLAAAAVAVQLGAVSVPAATAGGGLERAGIHNVCTKTERLSVRLPQLLRQRPPELSGFVGSGSDDPAGARAIYPGTSIDRIHGTDESAPPGQPAASICVRKLNRDVSELQRFNEFGAAAMVS